MGHRRDLGTLAERTGTPTRVETAASATEAPVRTLRHCWVLGPQGRRPGLLIGWQRRGAGPDAVWFGRVVHVIEGEDVVVEDWLPAHRLEPVEPVERVPPVARAGPVAPVDERRR